MKLFITKGVLLLGLLGMSAVASATSGGYAKFYVVYHPPLTTYNCLMQQSAEVVYDKLLAQLVKGVFAETRTYSAGEGVGDGTYHNVNVLANEATKITPVLNFYRVDAGAEEFSFTIDLASLNTRNSESVEGRQKTIDKAKLSVIAILKTAELNYGKGKFRVWIKFQNLPSLAGLTGSTISAGGLDWPKMPYTSSSLVYQSYLNDMNNVECGGNGVADL